MRVRLRSRLPAAAVGFALTGSIMAGCQGGGSGAATSGGPPPEVQRTLQERLGTGSGTTAPGNATGTPGGRPTGPPGR